MMNKIVLLFASKCLLLSNENLPIGEIFNRIAKKEGIERSKLRRFEKCLCKLAGLKLDLKYFDKCIELNLIPEFLKFKPPDLKAYQNISVYYNKVVREQKSVVYEELKDCKIKYREMINDLSNKLGFLEFRMLITSIQEKSVKLFKIEKINRHNKNCTIFGKDSAQSYQIA